LYFAVGGCNSSYVGYTPATQRLHVGYEHWGPNSVCTDDDLFSDSLTLNDCDQLGVRTNPDTIDVYVNGVLFNSYSYIAVDGPIGFGADFTGSPAGTSVSLDNFGGGKL
jgi:hypothetical protein